jgi:hypothetical protein
MSERERLIKDIESRKDTDRELEGYSRVRGRAGPGPRAVVSVRLSSDELKEITAAAGVFDRNVSEFIREAVLKEARQVRAGIEEARELMLMKEISQ